MNGGSHPRDRLPRLSGCDARFPLLWSGRRQPVSLSGRRDWGSLAHTPECGERTFQGCVLGQWVTSFTQDPGAKEGCHFTWQCFPCRLCPCWLAGWGPWGGAGHIHVTAWAPGGAAASPGRHLEGTLAITHS